jgi:hypothetical protein
MASAALFPPLSTWRIVSAARRSVGERFRLGVPRPGVERDRFLPGVLFIVFFVFFWRAKKKKQKKKKKSKNFLKESKKKMSVSFVLNGKTTNWDVTDPKMTLLDGIRSTPVS